MVRKIYFLFSLIILVPGLTQGNNFFERNYNELVIQDTNQVELPQTETEDPFWVETTSAVRLFRDMGNASSVILYIPLKETVEVFEEIDEYYSASYQGEKGYVLKAKVKPLNFQAAAESADVTPENKKDKLTYLQEKYDTNTADALFNHKVWVGMTTQMALDSWGYPISMDRYLRVEKKFEDWNYSKYTLVFEDNKLIRWVKK